MDFIFCANLTLWKIICIQEITVFLECDEIWIYIDSNTKKSKELIKIKSSFISETINHHNIIILKNKESLEAKLKNIQLLNANLLLMSSGNFSDINLENIFTIEI